MRKKPKKKEGQQRRASQVAREAKDPISKLRAKIGKRLSELSTGLEVPVYPLLSGNSLIQNTTVDDVYDDMCSKLKAGNKKLAVIVNSPGGDIHAAYNMALLMRRFARDDLTFIVPRWAKSAATLLVCGGNQIWMGPIAELGPVDPQITQLNPLEKRLEQFSPLHIEATLELIRDEFENGNKDLAKGLLERLQFPLTLGGFKKSLDIGKQCIVRLLTSRMFGSDDAADERADKVASALVGGYMDHGFCVDVYEAKRIGLVADEVPTEFWPIVWDIYKQSEEIEKVRLAEKQKKMEEKLKSLPPELLKSLPVAVPDMPQG